jgi:hypothetical protein
MTHMTKTQVYLREEDLRALQAAARRTGRSTASLIREAIQRVWIDETPLGPVALWDGPVSRSSVDHDSIYDEP